MLNAIVPPPMLFASRMAWRNEPEPLSLVLLTVKTKGVMGFFISDDSRPPLASRSLAFRMRPVRVSRTGLNEVANIEARKTEPIVINARVSAIRRAKACGEVFFFMCSFRWRLGGDEGGRGYTTFFYVKTSQRFQKKRINSELQRGIVRYRLTR